MKVLRVIASMDPKSGGPCQGIRYSAKATMDLGLITEVVCTDLPDAAYLGEDPFTIHAIGTKPNPWAYTPALADWLVENINRFNAVIVHGLWLYPSFATMKAIRELKRSGKATPNWFVMPHGMLDPYFQRAPERRLKALRNSIYWQLIEKRVINEASGIFFTCEEEMNLAKKTFLGYRPRNTYNIGYGIEAPPLLSAEQVEEIRKTWGIAAGKNYLLFLSRIHPKKGLSMLIDAYRALSKDEKWRDKLPHLVVAGPGMETPYGAAIKTIVNNSEFLKDRVHFAGMLSGGKKWGAFYGCEAFILPSHQENFGIAVAEALACGAPAIITDKVNIWRELEAGEAGIVGTDDEQGIKQALEKWLTCSDEEKSKMRQNAKTLFMQKFYIRSIAQYFVNTLFPTTSSGVLKK